MVPGPPYPNCMLTNDPVDARALSWMQVKYGIEGELYWSTTFFEGNVWEKATPSPGDGYLCYPGKPVGREGPVTCIRAERIRDAKEDIELIWLLRQLAAGEGREARAERVIRRALDQVVTNHTQYSKEDAAYDAARQAIVDEIIRLQ